MAGCRGALARLNADPAPRGAARPSGQSPAGLHPHLCLVGWLALGERGPAPARALGPRTRHALTRRLGPDLPAFPSRRRLPKTPAPLTPGPGEAGRGTRGHPKRSLESQIPREASGPGTGFPHTLLPPLPRGQVRTPDWASEAGLASALDRPTGTPNSSLPSSGPAGCHPPRQEASSQATPSRVDGALVSCPWPAPYPVIPHALAYPLPDTGRRQPGGPPAQPRTAGQVGQTG